MSFWKRIFGSTPEHETTPTSAEVPPDFAFPLVTVSGSNAIAAWKEYQALWRREGCSAVMLGDMEEVQRIMETLEQPELSAASILERAAAVDIQEYFAQRMSECVEDRGELDEGDWPAGRVPSTELGAHLDVLSRQPKRTLYLAKIPTAKAWEIPAHLFFGGWNDCPLPEHHVAVLRHWSEKYGVEIYAITGDVMECTVARPPKTQEDAMTLAREQFLYCTDIVHQGTESVSVLGATVLHAKAWYSGGIEFFAACVQLVRPTSPPPTPPAPQPTRRRG